MMKLQAASRQHVRLPCQPLFAGQKHSPVMWQPSLLAWGIHDFNSPAGSCSARGSSNFSKQ